MSTRLHELIEKMNATTRPHVSANDDGTISVEWRTQTKVLHVRVDGAECDAYFSDGTDEWES